MRTSEEGPTQEDAISCVFELALERFDDQLCRRREAAHSQPFQVWKGCSCRPLGGSVTGCGDLAHLPIRVDWVLITQVGGGAMSGRMLRAWDLVIRAWRLLGGHV